MFDNLRNGLQEKKITMKSYSQFLGITEKTLQNKMNGITAFSLPEVDKTMTYLFPEYKLEYIFDRCEKEEIA